LQDPDDDLDKAVRQVPPTLLPFGVEMEDLIPAFRSSGRMAAARLTSAVLPPDRDRKICRLV
jgi:hypothetical protein